MKQGFVKLVVALAAVLVAGTGSAQQAGRSSSAEGGMKIRIIIDGAELTATLEDNVASRDFAALLPLDLTLEDYNGTEKIADLPSRLSTKGMPEGVDPEIGDITYFAPWGNLALFYRDFGYARGLVRLGRVESGVEGLAGGGALSGRIERVKEPER
jgi:hypothetical protein